MSYAYLFKYIIIGDTGANELVLPLGAALLRPALPAQWEGGDQPQQTVIEWACTLPAVCGTAPCCRRKPPNWLR